MSVKTISKDELRRMEGSEGLILQGQRSHIQLIKMGKKE